MPIGDPYHDGELAVQQRANEVETAARNSRVLGKAIPARAFRFVEQQPMAVIGSVDGNGRVWASAIFGEPGFLRALDGHTLQIDLSQPRAARDDPLWANLDENPNVGVLVIELGSRRRLRINGRAKITSAERCIIAVDRAYPNCPKYIQRRDWKMSAAKPCLVSEPDSRGQKLGDSQKTLIANADTFFVASAHPDHGVDASHRGGPPGFVQILDDRRMRIPDFTGNSMFNTLGNFVSYPFGGLVFPDFERGRILQLTGRAEILWDLDDPAEETAGTRRYWQFDLSAWQECALPFHLEWDFLDYSPFIPKHCRYYS